MILQLQKYDIHIIHRAGKEIPVADTLSRKSIKYHDGALHEGMEAQVHMVLSGIPEWKKDCQKSRKQQQTIHNSPLWEMPHSPAGLTLGKGVQEDEE